MQHLEIDEWKSLGTSQQIIKETKIEKLEILIRILKNTTGIEAFFPKKRLIAW
jgi:hypothetical protein